MRLYRFCIDTLKRHATSIVYWATGVCWAMVVLLACIVLCSSGGCMPRIAEPEKEDPEQPEPFVVQPDEATSMDQLQLKVAANETLVSTLHEVLGNAGTIKLQPERAIVIRRPEATITIKPGTTVSYRLSERDGDITFAKPRPTISARVLGLKLSPELSRLELAADNTGTAHVQSGPIKTTRRFSLAWTDDAQAAATVLPIVYVYTAEWCIPCQQAHAAIDAALDLPVQFRFIDERSDQCPAWVTSLPTFHWQAGEAWRQTTGWSGMAAFLDVWRASQAAPAGTEQTVKTRVLPAR